MATPVRRYLAEITVKQGRCNVNVNVNDTLVQAGHAKYVAY